MRRVYHGPVTEPVAKVRMADIARLSGVSMATASRALSGASRVSESTRARVRRVADELSYVVSPEASRLAGGRTGRVAVVTPHISRWFFAALLEGLGTVLRDADLDVLLYHVKDAADRHRFFAELPAHRKVDAVVVLAFPVDQVEQQRLAVMGVDVIAAGGQIASYPFVCIDDDVAGRQAMDHLLFLGHRRIGMLSSYDPEDPAIAGRSNAYFAALDDAGIAVDDDLVVSRPWGADQGALSMAQLLSLREPPTAVYAHSDEVAMGALRTLRRAGLRVPEDMSVVGIDDHPLAELNDLTTVGQDVGEQGAVAGRMLVSILRGEPVDRAVTAPTQLIVRGSTTRWPASR
ncbi:LacI family DNA-binding transcriptional regulator [Acidothermaceae bacterium B102]|nr:LacI family DNA-binding transcriptional regulator [Acidothermaceae bacterium B102]